MNVRTLTIVAFIPSLVLWIILVFFHLFISSSLIRCDFCFNSHLSFKEIRRQLSKTSLLYFLTHTSFPSLFLLASLLVTNSLTFCSSENVFILHSCFKDSWIWCSRLQFYSYFSTINMSFHFSEFHFSCFPVSSVLLTLALVNQYFLFIFVFH